LNLIELVIEKIYIVEEIFLMGNIVIDHLWMIHQLLMMNMEKQFRYYDLQVHEDILLMYHELLLKFQYDQLNVEIP